MLKENAMYQKDDSSSLENADVNLTSKDMEVNFSNKQDDDDEIESRITPLEMGILGGTDKDFVNKQDTLDIIEEADLQGPVAGVMDDIKMMDKVKILEETKDQKKQVALKQTPGRSKLQNN